MYYFNNNYNHYIRMKIVNINNLLILCVLFLVFVFFYHIYFYQTSDDFRWIQRDSPTSLQ
jgi:hypothetical protein